MLKLVFVTSRPFVFLLSTFSCSFFLFSLFFPCSCVILPASHHHLSLSAPFFGTCSVIHTCPLAPVLMTQLIFSCTYSCVQRVALTPQASGVLFSCGCGSSLITTVGAATCLSSWLLLLVLPLFRTVVLLTDQKPHKCVCFPFAAA